MENMDTAVKLFWVLLIGNGIILLWIVLRNR